jgi:hypothetical protein
MLRGFSSLAKAATTSSKTLRPMPNKVSVYKPNRFLEFDENESLLIYKYTHTPGITIGTFLKRFLPTTGLVYLLVKNPWPFYTEPMCLPIFFLGTLYGLFKSWTSLALNTRTVHEIRLKKDGGFIELGFLNYWG